MLDLGTYGVVSQSFEYLVGLGPDGNIAQHGACHRLVARTRPVVCGRSICAQASMWQDGTEFTSADVAATMDRLAAQGNAGLAGVIGEGSVDASDPTKAVFTLIEANGNFPVLVSLFNAQALITPADYADGTTLDARPAGTGAWILDSFDASTFETKFSTQPQLVGWRDPSRHHRAARLRRHRHPGHGHDEPRRRRDPAGSGDRRRGSAQRPQLRTALAAGCRRTARCGSTRSRVSSPTSSCGRRLPGRSIGSRWSTRSVRRPGRNRATTTPCSRRCRSSTATPSSSAPATSTRRRRCWPRPVSRGSRQPSPRATSRRVPSSLRSSSRTPPRPGSTSRSTPSRTRRSTVLPGAPVRTRTTDTLPCDNSAEFGIVDYGHRPVPDVYFGSALATRWRLELVELRESGVRRQAVGVPAGGRRRRPEGCGRRDRRRSSGRTCRRSTRTSTTTCPATTSAWPTFSPRRSATLVVSKATKG